MNSRRWITVREAAEYLSIHYKSVYRLIDSGEIEAGRIGKNVRVDLPRLIEKLEGRDVERIHD